MSKITQHTGSRIRAFRKARGMTLQQLADLMPCAFKCLVTLTPQEPTEELKDQLLFTNKELRRWQKLNMLVVDNRG